MPVLQSPRLARTHCQNTYRALIPVYLALRNTARAPRKGWCVPKGGSARLRWNPDSCTACRCAKSTAAAPASARTAGQVAPASAASATRGPALVLPLGCVTSRLRLSCSGLTRGTQRECDPDLCLHVSVHVARRPRLRYSKMSSSAVRSVPAPGRGCGTRSNGRPVASSRLRLGVLHSEKNAVAATSGSKLVSTRSDSTRVGFKTVTEADDCCCLRSVCGLARREFMGGAASSRNLSRSISSSTSTSAR